MALRFLRSEGEPEGIELLASLHTLYNCLRQNKPYDPKKSCWVPDKSTGGFNEGLIESTEGEKVTVSAKGEVRR